MLNWLRAAFRAPPAAPARDERVRSAREAWARGDAPRAEQLFREILESEPDRADALAGLGEIAVAYGQNEDAAGLLERAISIDASQPRYHYGLGCALQSLGNSDGAIAAYRRALAGDPSNAGAHTNLGCLLQERAERGEADLDEAVTHLQAVCELAPQGAAAWLNLGYAMDRQRRLDEAIACYDRALALESNLAEAHFNRAIALLARGNFEEGWAEYEWRWLASGFARPAYPRPEWDGSPLGDGTLLVYTEQGFGDAIQFARYVRLARPRTGRTVLRSSPELRRLFAGMPDVAASIVDGDPLPEFDAHCSLLSLPRILGSHAPIASEGPYLEAGAAAREKWRGAVPRGKDLNVGLVWASQPMARIAPLKSIDFSLLRPLFQVPGVRFYSLQKGEAGRHAALAERRLADIAGGLEDFADTAAAIEQLDLTISVDTSVAHLAGAMAKPVWTLVPYVPDWRWQPDAEASAWYPTMRLYRQSRRGQWDDTVARVAADLHALSLEGGGLNRT